MLRLRFATVDFAVDTHQRWWWWFLEANPNGQWLWVEQATGLPIAAAVASSLLTARPRPCGERGPHGLSRPTVDLGEDTALADIR